MHMNWENIYVVKSGGHKLVAGHELDMVCKPNWKKCKLLLKMTSTGICESVQFMEL